jgi:CSLREA domain-containing protein
VDRPAGAACDIGAVEGSGPVLDPLDLLVDTAGDGDDALPGDGVCDADGPPVAEGDCTLRAAISEANTWPTDDVITIEAGQDPVLAVPGVLEDGNATGDLDILGPLVIDGSGGTVDADSLERVFEIHGGDVELRSLVVTGGAAVGVVPGEPAYGGGLSLRGGALALEGVVVTANQAASGGGIANPYLGRLDLDQVTVSANTATFSGGGIYAYAETTVVDSTISGNTVDYEDPCGSVGGLGGGLSVNAAVTVESSTISANTTSCGGGAIANWLDGDTVVAASTIVSTEANPIMRAFGTVTIGGSIVQAVGADCQATITSLGHNLGSDASCGWVGTGDGVGAAVLGPLADNGGPTSTHLPGPGSPAIDAIPASTPGWCDGTTRPDQRAVPRPQGVGCDIGAVEQ